MNKKLKQLIKKHVGIVKSMYPELYVEVDMVIDDILIGIGYPDIPYEEKYEELVDNYNEEYESKGYYYVYWAVNDTLTCDKLEMLEDFVKISEQEEIHRKEKIIRKENLKQSVVNF